jgi:arsenate reductase
MKKVKILFLCTGNSARSQIAEGWTKALKSNEIEAYSAGIEAHGLNPLATQVMAEAGVDISNQRSKLVDEVNNIDFDYVLTLCDNANAACPVFSGEAKVVHAGFADPAMISGSEKEKLKAFRQARDQIKKFVLLLPANLKESK